LDRRLFGFISIIIVTSTIVSITVFQVREEEHVRFLAHRTPENIPGGRPGAPSYSLDLMAVRPVPDLLVKVNFLVKLLAIPLEKPWNETEARSFEDLVSNVPRLRDLKGALDKLASELGYDTYEVFNFARGGEKLYVIDLTDSMERLAGREQLKTIYTLYAFDVDEYGNVSVYGGYRDFFFRRDTVIQQVKYSTPNRTVCFGSEAGASSGCLPVSEAPTGVIRLSDLKRGDRFHLQVVLDTKHMFGHSGIIELIRTQTGYGEGPSLMEKIGGKGT